MVLESPVALAEQIAKLLDSDPVAARQVREYLSDERLIELLELQVPLSAVDLDEEDPDAVLEIVVENFSTSEVLAAFAKKK